MPYLAGGQIRQEKRAQQLSLRQLIPSSSLTASTGASCLSDAPIAESRSSHPRVWTASHLAAGSVPPCIASKACSASLLREAKTDTQNFTTLLHARNQQRMAMIRTYLRHSPFALMINHTHTHEAHSGVYCKRDALQQKRKWRGVRARGLRRARCHQDPSLPSVCVQPFSSQGRGQTP